MKISIGTKIKDGPWGGGNLFAINLGNYLTRKGNEVIYNLDDDDIDVILLTEPRKTSESSAFTHIDILKYQHFVNNEVVVLHRINECDERKNTNYVNSYLIEANEVADATIFVSTWLRDLFIKQKIKNKNLNVILSGANSEIFNSKDQSILKQNEKIKLVTHHWGANWNKGFDIYEQLDNLLNEKSFSDKFSFTYIGNLPNKFKFKNSRVIEPLSGKDLAEEIKKNHIYITGSLNEPSGNHHIEAAQCGLPILYINSGGIPEYCKGFGLDFDHSNFRSQLVSIVDNYESIQKNMANYPHNAEIMSEEYESLMLNIYNQRKKISQNKSNVNLINFIEKYIYIISRHVKKKLKNNRLL